MKSLIYICDDQEARAKTLKLMLEELGAKVIVFTRGLELIQAFERKEVPSLVFINLILRDLDGLGLVSRLKSYCPIIMTLEERSKDMMRTCMLAGAKDVLILPTDQSRLEIILMQQMMILTLTKRHGGGSDFTSLSSAMQSVIKNADKAALSNLPVLITGEKGTGKQRLARYLHQRSDRGDRAFLNIDCASLHFVQEAAAYDRFKMTLNQGAGIVYFKNIDQLALPLQKSLAEALHEMPQKDKLKPRVFASAGTDLTDNVRAARFYSPLYYFFAVTPLSLPKFAERADDLPHILRETIYEEAADLGVMPYDFLLSDEIYQNFADIKRAVRLKLIQQDLKGEKATPLSPQEIMISKPKAFFNEGQIKPFEALERDIYLEAYQHYSGRLSEIAKHLKVGRSTLYRKYADYGVIEA